MTARVSLAVGSGRGVLAVGSDRGALAVGSGRGALAVGFRGFLGGRAFFLAAEDCGMAFAFLDRRSEVARVSPDSVALYLRFPEVDDAVVPVDIVRPFGLAGLERSENEITLAKLTSTHEMKPSMIVKW